jgi:hypothetical protein
MEAPWCDAWLLIFLAGSTWLLMRRPYNQRTAMTKNNESDAITKVVSGLMIFWTQYKRSAARRHRPYSFIDELFGYEMSDVEAAKYLAEDISEIKDTLKVKTTERKFNKIIRKSF